MRRRDIQQINPSAPWRAKAVAAREAVAAGTKTVNDFSKVWGEMKAELAQLSFGKCWYCESRQGRSDNAVDHFRPKSKYPWYAFSHENFRFACSFCNSPHRNSEAGQTQGKSDLFPLFENSTQATSEQDVDAEVPVLLDPCKANDPGMLDFRRDGAACPTFPDDPTRARRASESIRIYALNHAQLIEERRLLASSLEDWIKRAQRLYPLLSQGGDPAISQAFEGYMENIARALDDRAQLSAFARRIAKLHRDKAWIDALLITA
jgi:uncharacterized protein (TIGR02646 family)